MKCKKYNYILLLILMLIAGINKIYAAGPDSDNFCYYLSPESTSKKLKGYVELRYGPDAGGNNMLISGSMITIISNTKKDKETPMLNWSPHYSTGSGMRSIGRTAGSNSKTTNGTNFEMYYSHSTELMNETSPNCPKYIVIEHNKKVFHEYFGWGTESESLALQAVNSSDSKAEYTYASNYKNGKQITREMFFGTLKNEGIIERDKTIQEYTCETLQKDLFGTKSNPSKLRYYIDLGMQYVRILVPILIIVLGTLDFAKAVLAAKEDNMKKAQSTFVRRLLAGVMVFFVPLLVDVIMYLADIVWQGTGFTSCKF